MKRLILWIMLASAVLLMNTGRTSHALQASSSDGPDYAAMSEQVEIMRLVLTRSINSRFNAMIKEAFDEAGKAKADGGSPGTAGADSDLTAPAPGGGMGDGRYGLATVRGAAPSIFDGRNIQYGGFPSNSSQYTSHTRGFYTPGFGVFFTTEVDTPVEMVIKDPPPQEEVDAWEEAQREVQGRSGNFGIGVTSNTRNEKVRTWVIENSYIDAAIDALVDAIGEYGSRLDQLPDDEVVAVAMRMEPGLNLPVLTVSGAAPGAMGDTVPEADNTAGTLSTAYRVYTDSMYGSFGGVQRAAVAHVVIQVQKSDIQALQNGSVSKDAFRDRVKVTRY